jgi:uncharacterized membrane protein YbhN (UPF0104 family)
MTMGAKATSANSYGRRAPAPTARTGGTASWLRRTIGPGHKLAGLVALAALLAVGALVGVAWAAGFAAVWRILLHPHWWWLLAAVAGELVAFVGYTFAYREAARAEGGTHLEPPKAAALVTAGFGVFLQGGGFALDREALKRSGLSEREARQRVLGLGALEYAVLAPAAAIAGLIVYLRDASVSSGLTLPWLIGVPSGAALALGAYRFRDKLSGRHGWRRSVGHGLAALGLLFCMLRSLRSHWLAFVGIGAYWVGDIFCLWAALHAFSAQPPRTAELVVGYASGYAITRRALPLGGAGVVEALLPFALGWVGIALPQALLAVVAYRAINLWLPMIPGLAAIPTLARLRAPAGREFRRG